MGETDRSALPRIETDRLLLIVVGAHLRAEIGDRPLAYCLRQRLIDWLDARYGPENQHEAHPLSIVVCTDLWYLNREELRARPTLSIGGPGVNALAAFLGDKLASVFSIRDVLLVQADLEFVDVIASCWGIDEASTVAAVDAFCERYLDAFMQAAVDATEPV